MRSAKGSVYQLGPDRWRVQIEAPRDANTGKRSRPSTIVRGSRKKAEQVKAQMLIDAGYVSISSDIDVEEYAHSVFLNRKKKLIAKGKFKIRTLESYEERLRLHILPYIGHVQVQELRPIHVRMVQDAAPTDAVAREARKVLSSMITEAMYDELLASNPVKNVRPIDESDYEPEQLDVEDMEVYLWHFKDTRVENVVLLAIGGAYRRGEIVAQLGQEAVREDPVHHPRGRSPHPAQEPPAHEPHGGVRRHGQDGLLANPRRPFERDHDEEVLREAPRYAEVRRSRGSGRLPAKRGLRIDLRPVSERFSGRWHTMAHARGKRKRANRSLPC